MSPMTGTYSLATIDDLLPVLENRALGDSSVKLALASGQIKTEAHLRGALPVAFTFRVGGELTVAALNGQSGRDEAGVVAAADAPTPAGTFAPLLRFDGTSGWLRYSANADAKADIGVDIAMAKFLGGAVATIATADYRRHPLGDGLLTIVAQDLARLRSALVADHVRNLPDGDALAFRTTGRLTSTLDIEWSDVFTSEIGALGRLLPTPAPVAVRTSVGATCRVNVSVDDSFLVAFARRAGALVVAVRRSDVAAAGAAGGAAISVRIADPNAIERVLDDVVAALPSGAPNPPAIDALTSRAREALQRMVQAKVEAAFAYEYRRVRTDISLFEAEIPAGGPADDLHGQLAGGQLDGAFDRPASEIRVTKFLNDRKTTVHRAWGFTLGLDKWTLFGRDRREATLVEHVDRVARTMSRSYIGSGGYERNNLSWSVDFAADMRHGRPAPMVDDYTFGLHLAVVRDRQTFDAGDLEAAIDLSVLWGICPEDAATWVRRQLAAFVGRAAEWSFHVRVDDEAWRPVCRMLASMPPRGFAGAAAAALPPSLVPSVADRRRMYEPLWRALLSDRGGCNADTAGRTAGALLPDPALAARERVAATAAAGFDLATVAGTIRADDAWFDECASFSRGCRQLAEAVATPTADRGQVGEAYASMVRFWTQSHQVRTLGAAIVEAARAAGESSGVERTLNLTSGAQTVVIGASRF